MRMTMTRWLAGALALTTLVASNAEARTLQQVLNQGVLRIGVVLAAPWALRNEARELTGFEIDVGRQLAADMGTRPEFLIYQWDELVPALEAGEIDIVAAGLSISPDRAVHVNFSQPYSTGGVSLATHLGNTASVARLEDLNDDSYKVAAVEGTVAASLAQRILPRAALSLFDSEQSASEALVAGDVDAYLEDEPVPTYLALEHPNVVDVPIARPLLETRAGFAVAKGDADFLAYLNAWIVAREADTWLPTTHQYWFKSLRWRD